MRLSTYFLLVPVIVIVAALAVANRGNVGLSFDPFSDTDPALVIQMPLFLLLYLTFLAGVLVAGLAGLLSRAKRLAKKESPKESRELVTVDPRELSKPSA
ncbi:MAG: DUF1049 domain-containing protein [Alphaproteobacteria bacterium]